MINIKDVAKEIWQAKLRTKDFKNFIKLACDLLLARRLKYLPLKFHNISRKVEFLNGAVIHYRLNSGDLWSLREVFLFDAYRLPFDSDNIETIVDLGANIGLTSTWLNIQCRPKEIIAVEPSSANCKVTKRNFDQNHVPAIILEAAVGNSDGQVLFNESELSNAGSVSEFGNKSVLSVSMPTILSRLSNGGVIDLLKMDIEGGEQDLLTGDVSWLSSVRNIIAEFHPNVVDYDSLRKIIIDAGFTYLPPNSVFPGSMDSFVRNELN
mgnify:CR=1 FL=1